MPACSLVQALLHQRGRERPQPSLRTQLASIRRAGDRRALRLFLMKSGRLYAAIGMCRQAESCFEEALLLARADTNRVCAVDAMRSLAQLLNLAGDHYESLVFCRLLNPELQLIGAPRQLGQNYLRMAALHRSLHQPTHAIDCTARAACLAWSSRDQFLAGLSRLARAELSALTGDNTFAVALATRAVADFRSIEQGNAVVAATKVLAGARSLRGGAGSAPGAVEAKESSAPVADANHRARVPAVEKDVPNHPQQRSARDEPPTWQSLVWSEELNH